MQTISHNPKHHEPNMKKQDMKSATALAALTSWALLGASHAAVTVVDHHTFNDNATPAGLTTLGTPTYSGGSLILNGSTGLLDNSTVGVTDNFGIETIMTFDGSFPTFSFPLALTNGSNNGFGVVSIGNAVSGHANNLSGAFGGFTATVGTEYRLAIVRSGGTSTFYLNGVAQPGTTISTPATPSILTIGYNIDNSSNPEGFMTGKINEVRTFTFAPGAFNASSDLLSAATIPEPSVISLVVLPGLVLLRRRRHSPAPCDS
jgi:hypothetical protein